MKVTRILLLMVFAVMAIIECKSQCDTLLCENEVLDSIYIAETEEVKGKEKVLHAEPLYIDLIRDLGARKGEKEWNIGLGLTDNNEFDSYTALVEYEFAPIDRLGLEVELPFTMYYSNSALMPTDSVPKSKLNSLKFAAQYSFYVSEKNKTSMAIGYIQEFELIPFNNYGKKAMHNGNVYNPFLVAAKRFGDNFHTLVYTGPYIIQHFGSGKKLSTNYQINTNFHYMIPGTRNFIGVEFNKEITKSDFDMTIRPQMRLGIAHNLMVGIVAGIPIKRESERFSNFVRLIYEPGHKKAQ